MHDALACGRRFRTFHVVDDFNREALSTEIDLNLPAPRVVRVLIRIAANRGYPVMLRMDNGPEFIFLALAERAERDAVKLAFIQPGKPTQTAFIERFNRTYRTEILDFYLFRTLKEVREITEKWLSEYNCERPHESLNNDTGGIPTAPLFGRDLKKCMELKLGCLQNGELIIGGDWIIESGITDTEQLEITATPGVIRLRRREEDVFRA